MFAVFQSLMPLIGFLLGRSFADFISRFDHWIAFALLAYIGGDMLVGALKKNPDPNNNPSLHSLSFPRIILQALATSIDALAVGVSFALLNVNIYAASAFIGSVTLLICLSGALTGNTLGKILKSKAELFGGCVLIATGFKILIQHLFF